MKRITQGILCAATAGAFLVACSSTATSPGEDSGATLRVAAPSSEKAALDAVVTAFEKANPDAKVTVTYADADPYQSTLRTQLSSGTAPDVFYAWPGNGNAGAIQTLVPGGYLEDLSGRPWAKDVPAGFKSVTQVDGKTYIVPLTYTGIAAVYNKAALTATGKDEPKTWTEVLQLCDAAKKDGKVAFALGNQTPWVTQLVDYALVATTVYAEEPDFAARQQAGKASFADSGWKTAMEKYLEMNERGCFSENPLGTSVDTANEQVARGDAVAAVQVLAVAGQIEAMAPEGTEFGTFALPATDNPDDTRMPGAVGGAYAVNAKTGKKDVAHDFIDFLAQPAGTNLYAEKSSAGPALPNDSFKADESFQTLFTYQRQNRTVLFMDQLWPNAKVQQAHLTGVQDLFSGESTPEEVLAEMDKTYQGD
ncbi:ABC transporter substrate-binding protein [Streptomyces pilosus]|uniref:ABC transporter substrate-binding protein n=1 Tax=Streptomyces pilosus TaxID=28893 RepID=UPI0016785F82|nr:extracellular solute-binding protein [Streptomyces pilosus]GGV46027.1 ABC transporter substrate-binding protein [Streptomyces pilosus]